MRRRVTYGVIALIALLIIAVLLVLGIQDHHDTSFGRAMAEATTIAMATRAYHTEYGSFPTGSPVQIAASLSGQNPRHIVFITMRSKSIDSSGQFIDPWGRPYAIAITGQTNVVVKSAGKDEVFGTTDDIEANE
jgi:type II secretory pathway pseudopilin PulG